MELEGEATKGGPSVDKVVGLNDVRCDIAMMRTAEETVGWLGARGSSRSGVG